MKTMFRALEYAKRARTIPFLSPAEIEQCSPEVLHSIALLRSRGLYVNRTHSDQPEPPKVQFIDIDSN